MHRAEVLYAPPRKPRKRKVPPPLQPLVPKKVALRWHAEATAAFCDADLFLRWQEATQDERLEQLQSTIELIYGKSAVKYTALAPLAHEDRVFMCPKSRYVPERNVHTALQRLAKAEPLRLETTTTSLVTRLRPALLSVEVRRVLCDRPTRMCRCAHDWKRTWYSACAGRFGRTKCARSWRGRWTPPSLSTEPNKCNTRRRR
ncbi:hypothetical protein SPRG_10723 [Saprolegnia parasitica CBS 223.65]|uniref:Uncharacterized protein n=1 Tax=Saprolegnia parasitica (strain CBS 223.65) TaxID=695850 RepID=A0A067BYB7_SAPPC|nr:hypothetical protein SPRG_10723 [Saprolegnia parasitica CBS 223.65]KDO23529.1 hypothetical protein SPRG_10723 [Saprolegnia parasitica CBS 223.65]|eukprot:XP_012205681.1 hypothetical protein SPRG_10723 [Saprolegnia parasitica CBS 223.65]